MIAKEKAKYLVNKFSTVGLQQREEGIACALIACDEIINSAEDNEQYKLYASDLSDFSNYWMKVKQEIEKL